jgi:hypothetical protein
LRVGSGIFDRQRSSNPEKVLAFSLMPTFARFALHFDRTAPFVVLQYFVLMVPIPVQVALPPWGMDGFIGPQVAQALGPIAHALAMGEPYAHGFDGSL